ncbi:MAG: hypothetical protein IKV94_02575 [Clostridia bacterium]|nr:hypothetical protein [Clostridia bacterium]MBR6517099.1 hypothetical protein [Bacilli bacterium]
MKKFRNLRADEIDVRINQIASNYCTMLLYKDARCDMNILDETVGALNWKREHTRDNANCVVSIYDGEKWVSKEDTGTESFSEAEKGLASDSFKRACVNWGIGRELYSSPNIITFPRKDMIPKGKDSEFFENDKGKYTTKTYFYVEVIDYDENDNIKDLIIRDNKNNIRFSQLSKEKDKELSKLMDTMKKMIIANEEKDDTFDREKFYKYFNVESDANLTYKQVEEAITLLDKRLQ